MEIPIHGLIWSKDNSLTYFIKRFDRKGQNDKIPVEDFAQLGGLSRDTKYDYSIELSPCYDLLNSTIELKKQEEEIALPIKGKKKHLTQNILIDYFGKERCELTNKVVNKILESITSAIPEWMDMINISFLSDDMKKKYLDLLNTRLSIIKIS